MTMIRSMLSLTLLIAASSAIAADDAANPQDDDKQICKTEPITGSRSRVRKICMTRAEWDELSRKTQKDMVDFRRDSGRATPQVSPMGGTTGF